MGARDSGAKFGAALDVLMAAKADFANLLEAIVGRKWQFLEGFFFLIACALASQLRDGKRK